jgi:type II restriction enzyme
MSCPAILGTGTNKGKVCSKTSKFGPYCGYHKGKGMSLGDNTARETTHSQWKSKSKIIGEFFENKFVNGNCPICDSKALAKYKAGEKSRDIFCTECRSDFQIKATKASFGGESFKLLGAEYTTTLDSVRNGAKINYVVFFYSPVGDLIQPNNMVFIHHSKITEDSIIPRKPLRPSAKRAGWQGCHISFNCS